MSVKKQNQSDNEEMTVGILLAYLNRLKENGQIDNSTPIRSDYPFF